MLSHWEDNPFSSFWTRAGANSSFQQESGYLPHQGHGTAPGDLQTWALCFCFFLFTPSLGGRSCSAHACPEALTCSRNVNHLGSFITWSQVETLSNKKRKNEQPLCFCATLACAALIIFFSLCPAELVRNAVVREFRRREFYSPVGMWGWTLIFIFML